MQASPGSLPLSDLLADAHKIIEFESAMTTQQKQDLMFANNSVNAGTNADTRGSHFAPKPFGGDASFDGPSAMGSYGSNNIPISNNSNRIAVRKAPSTDDTSMFDHDGITTTVHKSNGAGNSNSSSDYNINGRNRIIDGIVGSLEDIPPAKNRIFISQKVKSEGEKYEYPLCN